MEKCSAEALTLLSLPLPPPSPAGFLLCRCTDQSLGRRLRGFPGLLSAPGSFLPSITFISHRGTMSWFSAQLPADPVLWFSWSP